jgi:hypothetical protein
MGSPRPPHLTAARFSNQLTISRTGQFPDICRCNLARNGVTEILVNPVKHVHPIFRHVAK